MTRNNSGRMQAISMITAVLTLAVSVMMFLPFWHFEEQSISINSYVWKPSEHTDFERSLAEELGHKPDVNQIVRMPALMFLPEWIGIALCLIMRTSAWQMICTLPFGVFGVIGFLSSDALRLGSTWRLMMILCFAIIIADLIDLLSCRGK